MWQLSHHLSNALLPTKPDPDPSIKIKACPPQPELNRPNTHTPYDHKDEDRSSELDLDEILTSLRV